VVVVDRDVPGHVDCAADCDNAGPGVAEAAAFGEYDSGCAY